MPAFHPDDPIRLDDYRFSTTEIVAICGLRESVLRNWQSRGVLPPAGQRFAGRLTYNLIDAIRLTAMRDLVGRVAMPPADAAKVSELVVRAVLAHLPQGVADPNVISRRLALVTATVDGEPSVSLEDPTQPGYADWPGQWTAAHTVVPIAELVAGVIGRALSVLLARRAVA